jgi:hypothetical protein
MLLASKNMVEISQNKLQVVPYIISISFHVVFFLILLIIVSLDIYQTSHLDAQKDADIMHVDIVHNNFLEYKKLEPVQEVRNDKPVEVSNQPLKQIELEETAEVILNKEQNKEIKLSVETKKDSNTTENNKYEKVLASYFYSRLKKVSLLLTGNFYILVRLDKAGNIVRCDINGIENILVKDKLVDIIRNLSPVPSPPESEVNSEFVQYVIPMIVN